MENKKKIKEEISKEPFIMRESSERLSDGNIIKSEGVLISGTTLEEVKKIYDSIRLSEGLFKKSKKTKEGFWIKMLAEEEDFEDLIREEEDFEIDYDIEFFYYYENLRIAS